MSAYAGGDRSSASTTDTYDTENASGSNTTRSTLGWGNTLAAFRWNHVYGPKLFSNVATTYTKYRFNTATEFINKSFDKTANQEDDRYYKYDYVSGIEDGAARVDFRLHTS
ncbi:MAG: hypothetical protein WDO15_19530 [Bacteroidota bacterium]